MLRNKKFVSIGLISGLLMVTLLSSASAASAAPGETASTLSTKLAKAGLGCKDLKASKEKILYSGKRWTCTVKGLPTNIEFYSTANLKKAGKYLCDAGVDYPLVTDGKTWTVTTGNSAVDASVAKALKVSIKKACKF